MFSQKYTIDSVSPGQKLLLGGSALILSLILPSYFARVFIAVFMSFLAVKLSKERAGVYFALFSAPVFFALVTFFALSVSFSPENAVFSAGFLHMSREGMKNGGEVFFRTVSAAASALFIAFTVSFPYLMRVLRRLKLPHFVVALFEMTFRFIFVLKDEAVKIETAQKCRMGYKDGKTALRSVGLLASNLFILSYKKCDRIYNSLLSRGYCGVFPAVEREYPFSVPLFCLEILLIFISLAVFILERRFLWSF